MDQPIDLVAIQKHCNDLHLQVRALLEKEPNHIRINVLLGCVVAATNDVPCEVWVPFLAAFLSVVGQRNGLFFSSQDCSEDGEESEPETTMH